MRETHIETLFIYICFSAKEMQTQSYLRLRWSDAVRAKFIETVPLWWIIFEPGLTIAEAYVRSVFVFL